MYTDLPQHIQDLVRYFLQANEFVKAKAIYDAWHDRLAAGDVDLNEYETGQDSTPIRANNLKVANHE